MEQLPYVRDRIVEIYLWAVGCLFEPEYALSREIISKGVAMTSLLDDTFDAYGAMEELEPFSEAFERFFESCQLYYSIF